MHPDAVRWGISRYKIRGYCYPEQTPAPAEIALTIAGFNTAHLSLKEEK
jgi:hypothetical protein